jgi:hypothetical protein
MTTRPPSARLRWVRNQLQDVLPVALAAAVEDFVADCV